MLPKVMLLDVYKFISLPSPFYHDFKSFCLTINGLALNFGFSLYYYCYTSFLQVDIFLIYLCICFVLGIAHKQQITMLLKIRYTLGVFSSILNTNVFELTCTILCFLFTIFTPISLSSFLSSIAYVIFLFSSFSFCQYKIYRLFSIFIAVTFYPANLPTFFKTKQLFSISILDYSLAT